VLDKCSSRSVYLGVCPVQFALYVKLPTVMRAAHVFSGSTINKYTQDYRELISACQCDNNVNNGYIVLNRAYFNSCLKSADRLMPSFNILIL